MRHDWPGVSGEGSREEYGEVKVLRGGEASGILASEGRVRRKQLEEEEGGWESGPLNRRLNRRF